jgi:mannuronan 5-epimerase
MILMVSILFLAFGLAVSLATGFRNYAYSSFPIVPRQAIAHSVGPIDLVLAGEPPNSTDGNPLPSEPSIQAIVVSPHRVTLLSGGLSSHVIKTPKSPANLTSVLQDVHNASWLSSSSPTTITLKAALVINGVRFTIGSPVVTHVQLLDQPFVFIGAENAVLDFTHVSVDTLNPQRHGYFHPFVVAAEHSTMNIANSSFSQLGWNADASYGVSWVTGATGRVINSSFSQSYIGVYTDHAVNLVFENDVFRDNHLYGLDPHTYSRGLNINHVIAEGNRAIGIIFANHVTRSAIRDSISRDNGENGIMMYQDSSQNLIKNDVVEHNRGDGLVVSYSSNDIFSNDMSTSNRIGIRVTASPNAHLTFTENQIIDNDLASQGVSLSSSNTISNNGGQPNWRSLKIVWTSFGAAWFLFALLLAAFSGRRRPPASAVGARYAKVTGLT